MSAKNLSMERKKDLSMKERSSFYNFKRAPAKVGLLSLVLDLGVEMDCDPLLHHHLVYPEIMLSQRQDTRP